MAKLYLVATPIGNLEDITIRAIRTLFSVDYILCEDTRRTGQLIQNLESRIKSQELRIKDLNIDKKPQFISFYDEIELKKVPEVIDLLLNNKNVALVSDSGTPLIVDPGYKLVTECIKRGIKIISIPGPSSTITALILSGLPPNDFRFIGYIPSNKTKRQKLFNELLSNMFGKRPTIIAFETPHRIKESLMGMQSIFGDINICICRELTKIHEEIFRGKISEALLSFDNPKGEFVLLFNIPQE